jgi:hypothetical protein
VIVHASWCRQTALGHTDAAKRLSDIYNLHRIGSPYGSIGRWFAVALIDGRGDGELYDSKSDCVFHQGHNEQYYTFIKIVPSTMSECEAEVMMSVARRAYDNGLRLADPDSKSGGHELIKRTSIEDMLNLANGRVSNVIMPGRAN